MIYVPRVTGSIDKIFNEDPLRRYTDAIPVEMYIKNIEGFAGEGDFLSKFNIQIRDQITFSIARRTFANEVGMLDYLDRPREGDLVYLPLNQKLFEVKFVEHEAIFYQMGSLQMWDLKCELFEYNNEYLKTGIKEIDKLHTEYSLSLDIFGLMLEGSQNIGFATEDGYGILLEDYDINENDLLADNDDFQTESDDIIDFTERDPFSEGLY